MAEISVIVPVFNVETKLKRCLDSIKNQTFSDFEVIIIDDGSTDSSPIICDEYAKTDARFKVFHIENGGVSNARNLGISQSSGKYISFVDSDDYIESEYLEMLVKDMPLDVDMSICGVYICAEEDESKSFCDARKDSIIEIKKENTNEFKGLLRSRRFNYVYGKLYKTEVIVKNKVAFLSDVNIGEDTIFVFDYLLCVSKIKIVGKPYYNYVKYQSGTLSSARHVDLYDKLELVNNKIEESLKTLDVFNEEMLSAISFRRQECMFYAINAIRSSLLKNKEKQSKITELLNKESVLRALRHNNEFDKFIVQMKWIRKGDAKGLLRFYAKKERKERRITRFKILVIKIFPKKLVRTVKKWLNVQ